jgi:hypothetical protein
MLGAFWKSFGDYHPSIWNWPPFDGNVSERHFGLLRHDGSAKPAAVAFREDTAEKPKKEKSDTWVDVPKEEFLKHPKGHVTRLYHRFREYYDVGF